MNCAKFRICCWAFASLCGVAPLACLAADPNWIAVLRDASPSIVYLKIGKTNKSTGAVTYFGATGFVVGKDGWVLTAAHSMTDPLVDASNQPIATLPPEVWGRVGSRAPEPDQELRVDTILGREDLALLQFKEYSLPRPTFKIGAANSVEVGTTPLAAFGFPLDQPLSIKDVKVSSKGGADMHWNVTAQITHGMSGSPVLNANGEVVAVVIGGDERAAELKYAMPINAAVNLLLKAEAVFVAAPIAPVAAAGMSTRKPLEQIDDEAPEEARIVRTHVRAFPIPADKQVEWAQVSVSDAESLGLSGVPIVDIAASRKVVNVQFGLESGPRSQGKKGRIKALVEMMLVPN